MSKQQSALIRKLRKEVRALKAVDLMRRDSIEAMDKKCNEFNYMWQQVQQLVAHFAPVGSPLHFSVFPQLERNPLPTDGRMLQFQRRPKGIPSMHAAFNLEHLSEFGVILREQGENMQAVMLADGKRYYVNTDFYKEVPLDMLSDMVMKLLNQSLEALKASKQ